MTHTEFWQWMIIYAVGGATAGLMVWLAQSAREYYLINRDKKRIFKWMNNEYNSANAILVYTIREIANEVNLPEDRVRYICRIHTEIGEAPDHPDMWGLNVLLLNDE